MDASAIPNLTRLAHDSDLLVVHVGVLDPPNSPEILYTLHTPPKQIGEAARDAGVKQLLLSHISPAIEERRTQVVKSIGSSYKQNISFAYDGKSIPVPITTPSVHKTVRSFSNTRPHP
jgi:ribonuclease BN (tRNA processing enzyme)